MRNYIAFGRPDIRDAEIAEVVDSLKKGWLGTGPKVKRFESDFADYKEVCVDNVAALNSCTAALHLALKVAGIGLGDEVITTALTFCATVNSIIHTGGTPVLADVDPATCNISIASIESKITANTKAIVPVHYAGCPCDMDAIMMIAKKHKLKVIEDCAHAVEGEYKGRKLGTIGDFGCFSFYVTKNITTGEGGMLIAKDPKDVTDVRILALHGMSADAWARFSDTGYKSYEIVAPGYKYNMMDIQAAIGIHQLSRVEENWECRRSLFEFYCRELSDLPIVLPTVVSEHDRDSYHLFPVLVGEAGLSRDEIMRKLHNKGIGTGIHYANLSGAKYYREHYGWCENDTPVASDIGRQTMSLPFSSVLTDVEARYIVDSMKEVLSIGGD